MAVRTLSRVRPFSADRLCEDHQRVIGMATKGAHILLVLCLYAFYKTHNSLLLMFWRKRFRDNYPTGREDHALSSSARRLHVRCWRIRDSEDRNGKSDLPHVLRQ